MKKVHPEPFRSSGLEPCHIFKLHYEDRSHRSGARRRGYTVSPLAPSEQGATEDSIAVVDVNAWKGKGEATDIASTSLFSNHPDIYAGATHSLWDASMMIMPTAGHAPRLGETDQALLGAKLEIMTIVTPKMGKLATRMLLL
ncbi:hypothetical protein LTR95_007776 [Oleoguttula sp. CCFEE 5521]